mmetsp:Transcript_99490/g.252758  ORF Transcript_99490/g.252758 Transcript_99490/m.252758 type:complete len:200 (+) Transcript_99490:411-1010(+)
MPQDFSIFGSSAKTCSDERQSTTTEAQRALSFGSLVFLRRAPRIPPTAASSSNFDGMEASGASGAQGRNHFGRGTNSLSSSGVNLRDLPSAAQDEATRERAREHKSPSLVTSGSPEYRFVRGFFCFLFFAPVVLPVATSLSSPSAAAASAFCFLFLLALTGGVEASAGLSSACQFPSRSRSSFTEGAMGRGTPTLSRQR